MSNPEIAMTLDECVAEVLGSLLGTEINPVPEFDLYYAVARQLNRALRANARAREWSYYTSTEGVGTAVEGVRDVNMRASLRPRIIGDDAVRLVDANGITRVWAYFLPRDALEKYIGRRQLWVSSTRSTLTFSRPFTAQEAGLMIHVPVMRAPKLFHLPVQPENDTDPLVDVPLAVRNQLLDFDEPDAVLQRAAFYYAQTDPVMQPRVQTLEAEYKNTFYDLNERDDRNTDAPFMNEFSVPIQSDVNGSSYQDWLHPHADERH